MDKAAAEMDDMLAVDAPKLPALSVLYTAALVAANVVAVNVPAAIVFAAIVLADSAPTRNVPADMKLWIELYADRRDVDMAPVDSVLPNSEPATIVLTVAADSVAVPATVRYGVIVLDAVRAVIVAFPAERDFVAMLADAIVADVMAERLAVDVTIELPIRDVMLADVVLIVAIHAVAAERVLADRVENAAWLAVTLAKTASAEPDPFSVPIVVDRLLTTPLR